MGDWNPNDTGTLGLEWFPYVQGATALDGPTKVAATSIDQTAVATIGTVHVPNVGIPVRGGLYTVEVYDGQNGVPADSVSVLEAAPNEDVTDGNWVNQLGNNTDLFDRINEGSGAISTADYMRRTGTSTTATQRFNTATLSLTGKRILGVQLACYISMSPNSQFSAGLNLSGVDHLGIGPVQGPRGVGWVEKTWLYNPQTKRPWTIADVQALDSTDEFYLTGASSAGLYAVDVHTVGLFVYICTENRIAIGTLDDTGSALTAGTVATPVWNAAANMLTPTAGAWSKDGAGSHLYTVRRLNNTGSMNVPYLDAVSAYAPVAEGWDALVDPTWGYISTMDTAAGIDSCPPGLVCIAEMEAQLPRTKVYPFNVRTTAPADHTDSATYAALTAVDVTVANKVQQEVSGAAAANYGIIKFLARRNGASSSLSVSLWDRSGPTQKGTTYTLTPTELDAQPDLGNGWRLMTIQLGTAGTLAVGPQYYVEFSVGSNDGWQIYVAVVPASFGSTANYTGTTNVVTYGGSDNNNADAPVTVSTIPTAPASLTVALGSQTVTETVNCVTAISRADLSWATTALGGSFLRYEIERSEDGGTTWTPIAYVTVESVAAWKDYEGKRGVSTTYRIRVVRTDGAFSAWRAGGSSVTKALLSGTGAYGATLFLVSNYSPTGNLAVEYRPTKDYEFPESGEQVASPTFMRDYQIAANPIENRGVVTRWAVIVGADDKVAAGQSWRAFDPLRTLARAVIPYVCVLDHRGNRMFAQLRVPAGNEDSTGAADVYIADVSAVEIVDDPYVVSVAA